MPRPKSQQAVKAVKNGKKSNVDAPPTELLDLIENFLHANQFNTALTAFKEQRSKKGWEGAAVTVHKDEQQTLVEIFDKYNNSLKSQGASAASGAASKSDDESDSSSDDSSSDEDSDAESDVEMKDAEAPASSGSASADSSDSSGSDSESKDVGDAAAKNDAADTSDDSDSDSESSSDDDASANPGLGAPLAPIPPVNPLKRKAASESDSESDSDDSSDESSSEDKNPIKKQKMDSDSSDESSSDESSSDDSSSDDSGSDSDEEPATAKKGVAVKAEKGNSDGESSDDSDSSSDTSNGSESDSEDSDDDANLEQAANTKLPDSGSSDSASDSDSDSESESNDPVKKGHSPSLPFKNGSDSSVTMGKTSPDLFPPLPPDPTKQNNRGRKNGGVPSAKQQNVPFSRVPRDITVDNKFRSNRFEDNAHGWGARAHEDLIVTKGKGFTKEKNKKKRGSYRGGAIDTNARNGIKFDD